MTFARRDGQNMSTPLSKHNTFVYQAFARQPCCKWSCKIEHKKLYHWHMNPKWNCAKNYLIWNKNRINAIFKSCARLHDKYEKYYCPHSIYKSCKEMSCPVCSHIIILVLLLREYYYIYTYIFRWWYRWMHSRKWSRKTTRGKIR